MAAIDTSPFRRNEKVTAVHDLHAVPEGTRGKVKMVNGLTWTRYWVLFDNGEWVGQIDHDDLVRTRDWPEYQAARERGDFDQPEETAEADAGGGDEGAAAAEGDGRVPAHLLERSRKARERLGAPR